MARSLSLAAYRALSARGTKDKLDAPAPRPDGALVWMHATSYERLAAMQDVAARLRVLRDDVHTLITYGGTIPERAQITARGAHWVMRLDTDTPGYVRAFLSHWDPDICIWTGGHFLPFTLVTAQEAGIPLLLVDADEDGIRSSAGRWIPSLAGKSLSCFDRIFASGGETAQRLARRGIAPSKIEVAPPLQLTSNPPPTDEDMIDDATQLLAGRMVWLAAHLQHDELDTVLDAHLNASRLAHRLILALIPAKGVSSEEIGHRLTERGLRWLAWDAGGEPDDYTQVILIEDDAELGLWLRLASVSFMGSSLTPGHGGSNPFDAAALGSAVLYGPNMRDHMAAYTRLASAGAARIVKDAESLSAGVMQLIAPDRAASMALSAWEVVSEGAQITDHLLDLIQDSLDRKEGR